MSNTIKGSDLDTKEVIWVFERGKCKFVRSIGFSREFAERRNEVIYNRRLIQACDANCFHLAKDRHKYRLWSLNEAKIEVTYDPIRIIYRGSPFLVIFDDRGESLLCRDGQILPKDWEGYGIDFAMIISKWLRRLNNERIPLSEYYRDPMNRFFDNL